MATGVKRYYARIITKNVDSLRKKYRMSQAEFGRRLEEYFGKDCTWASSSSLNRILKIHDEGNADAAKDVPSGFVAACATILAVSIDELYNDQFTPSPQLEHKVDGNELDDRRNQRDAGDKPSPHRVYESTIEARFDDRTRVVIAPTEPGESDDKRFSVLTACAADELATRLRQYGSRRVLVAPGKTTWTVAGYLSDPGRPSSVSTGPEWLPAIGDFGESEVFMTHKLCQKLARGWGGSAPGRLCTPGLVHAKEVSDLKELEFDDIYERMFGKRVAGPDTSCTAAQCDAAILGCGIAVPGNPFFEDTERHADPEQLIRAPTRAIGEFNGKYVGVGEDGIPVVFSESPWSKDKSNPAAWSANVRTLGASPWIYQHIANRNRCRRRSGAGVILVARHASLAPVVLVALQLGLANVIVLDFECAKKLYCFIIRSSSGRMRMVKRFNW